MIAAFILIVLVTILSVHSAFGIYQNQQDIKALTDVIKEQEAKIRQLYQCDLELDNSVIGVKLNADGNWSEIRANDKQKGR